MEEKSLLEHDTSAKYNSTEPKNSSGREHIPLPREIALTSEGNPLVVVKGVMDDVEEETKNNGIAPKVTLSLALAKALRKNIETATNTLEKAAYKFTAVDWAFFIIASLCMGLISMGIEYHITPSFTLNQLLAALAFAAKSLEKSLNLRGVAKDKANQAKELKTLTQQVSSLEFSLYLQPESSDTTVRNKNIVTMQTIWTQFNNVELKTFLPPPRPNPDNV